MMENTRKVDLFSTQISIFSKSPLIISLDKQILNRNIIHYIARFSNKWVGKRDTPYFRIDPSRNNPALHLCLLAAHRIHIWAHPYE